MGLRPGAHKDITHLNDLSSENWSNLNVRGGPTTQANSSGLVWSTFAGRVTFGLHSGAGHGTSYSLSECRKVSTEDAMSYKSLHLMMILLLVLGGCAPMVSTQPLSDPMTEEPDKSLYGHWVSVTNSGTQYHVYIGESGKTAGDVSKPFMEGLLFSWKSDGSTKKINPMYSGYLTVSRIGSSSYINVYATPDMEGKRIEAHTSSDNWRYETWLRNPDKLVGIFRYVVQENRVTFWDASNSKPLQQNLLERAELIAVSGNKLFSDIKPPDTPVTFDSLFRYLRKNGGETLFGSPTTFTKVP